MFQHMCNDYCECVKWNTLIFMRSMTSFTIKVQLQGSTLSAGVDSFEKKMSAGEGGGGEVDEWVIRCIQPVYHNYFRKRLNSLDHYNKHTSHNHMDLMIEEIQACMYSRLVHSHHINVPCNCCTIWYNWSIHHIII